MLVYVDNHRIDANIFFLCQPIVVSYIRTDCVYARNFNLPPSICLIGPVNHLRAEKNHKPSEYITTIATATGA